MSRLHVLVSTRHIQLQLYAWIPTTELSQHVRKYFARDVLLIPGNAITAWPLPPD
jgi:hypothetical protein